MLLYRRQVRHDLPFEVTVPLFRDVTSQAPQAICELVPANASTNQITNRDAPPFDNPEMRRALALSLDLIFDGVAPSRNRWFEDSPLERNGFERSVPR
jgi:hypothetical protein